jgi:1,4-alpha-glucan branching enzyme
VFAFVRKGEEGRDPPLLVVINMTPVQRNDYRIGVPASDGNTPSRWRELINTDAGVYGGSGISNGDIINGQLHSSHGMMQSVVLTLPPLSVLILKQVH